VLNLKKTAFADGTAYFVRAASYECNTFIKSTADKFYDIGLWFEVETEKTEKDDLKKIGFFLFSSKEIRKFVIGMEKHFTILLRSS
jgi:hypothetical protein